MEQKVFESPRKCTRGTLIPARPLPKYVTDAHGNTLDILFDCPNCKDSYVGALVNDFYHNFCPKCGQAIRWKQTEPVVRGKVETHER